MRARAEGFATRALLGLPPRLQVRLSGRPAVSLDGDTLGPETQLMLALLARRDPVPMSVLGPERARAERRRMATVVAGRPAPVAAVSDLALELPGRTVAARHYVPAEPGERLPLLVFYHGGGFVFGDLETHDGVCRMLCLHGGAHVLAIDYRLAPEDPFPAAVEDARDSFQWAVANAERLGIDPHRIAVGGDSAGGNLAAVVAQLAAAGGGIQPALQLLIYPATDMVERRRSRELFSDGFFLTDAEMTWFEQQYLGAGSADRHDPRLSPLRAGDLSGLAPAIVATAAFDPLRDEGEEYAQALGAAGTPVLLRRFPGAIHGFASATGVSRPARDAVIELAGSMRAMLAGAAVTAPAAVAGSL
jgi:acetyl esterase